MLSYMMRQFWTLLILGRVLSLVMGCSAGAPAHHRTVPMSGDARSVDSRSGGQRGNGGSSGTVSQLKGKGSNVESTSRHATAQKMEDWNVTAEKVQAVAPFVEAAARKNNLPASLIYGIIWVESRFNPDAVSPVGAQGLMQLMPKTAAYLAECMEWDGRVDAFNPDFNIAAGSYYIARLIKQFDGDVDLALAAYNAGAGNIRKWMNNTGLPKVSIEYYTMVQTAQNYFPTTGASNPGSEPLKAQVPSNDDLDKLGLAILIAGLSNRQFGLERPDDANPFGDM